MISLFIKRGEARGSKAYLTAVYEDGKLRQRGYRTVSEFTQDNYNEALEDLKGTYLNGMPIREQKYNLSEL